mmetsp:Transcript_9025/g.25010  ORF Transcript_9025/g.25010 Transcript_9025/m.25010 type:complete len:454 (-) Transcript_9025:84-1445(-)
MLLFDSCSCRQLHLFFQLRLHFFFAFPSFKPGNAMLSCSIKNVAPMHRLVVIQQDNITFSHFDVSGVLLGNFVHVNQLFVRDLTIVTKEHVGFVDLTGAVFESLRTVNGFTVFAQFGRVRVNVAKPCGLGGGGMHHNGWLRRSPSLQHFGIIVSSFSPQHFHIKVNLGIDRRRNNTLHNGHGRSLHRIGQIVNPSKKREFHNRVTNLTIVKFIHQISIQIAKHSSSIGNNEFATRFCRLEADKSCGSRGTCANKLIVHANKKVLSALLVDGFVDRRVFVSIDRGTSRNRMKGVQASFHADGFVKLLEPFLFFHEFKIPKHYGSMNLHLLLEIHGILLKIFQLSILVASDSQILGREFGGEFGHLLLAKLLLQRANIRNLVTPLGQGGHWRGFDRLGGHVLSNISVPLSMLMMHGCKGSTRSQKEREWNQGKLHDECVYCSSQLQGAAGISTID